MNLCRIYRVSNIGYLTRNVHSLFKLQAYRTLTFTGTFFKPNRLSNEHSCAESQFRGWNQKRRVTDKFHFETSRNIFKDHGRLYSSSRLQTQKVDKETREDNMAVLKNMKLAIHQAASVDEVFEVWNKMEQDIKCINSVLLKLIALIEEDPSLQESFLNNLSCVAFGDYIQQHMTSLNQFALISALSFYTTLDSADLPTTEALLNHVHRTALNLELSTLSQIQRTLKNHQETSLRELVLADISDLINSRWHLKSSGGTTTDIITMMYMVYNTKEKMDETDRVLKMNKLEKDALEKCSEMNNKELYRIFSILSKQKRRNTPLLQALSNGLNKSYFNFTLVQVANLAYACASLNYYDSQLLNNISKNVRNRLGDINEKEVSLLPKLLHSLSLLRWRDGLLIESVISAWLEAKNYDLNNLGKLSDINEIYDIFNSCAHLNHISSSLVEYLNYGNFNRVINQLKGAYLEDQPVKWLNVVSNAGILGLLTDEMAESVLNSEFCDRITGNAAHEVHANKLLAVNACAVCELQDYKGPVLEEEFKQLYMTKAPKRKARSAHKTLFSTFAVMAPTQKYIRADTHSPLGHLIDFEIVVNNEGELQPLEGKTSTDVHRIAIQVLEFSHMTLSTNKDIGRVSLTKRHLKAEGYKVIHVIANYFLSWTNDVQRVQYIQSKINSVLAKPQTNKPQTNTKSKGLKSPVMEELLSEN